MPRPVWIPMPYAQVQAICTLLCVTHGIQQVARNAGRSLTPAEKVKVDSLDKAAAAFMTHNFGSDIKGAINWSAARLHPDYRDESELAN